MVQQMIDKGLLTPPEGFEIQEKIEQYEEPDKETEEPPKELVEK
jgi:hypothetical protein